MSQSKNTKNTWLFCIFEHTEFCMMEQDIPLELMAKKGKMTKKPWLMSPAERGEWLRSMQLEAKAYLFSIGQPLVYKKDGNFIAEYADGSTRVLK